MNTVVVALVAAILGAMALTLVVVLTILARTRSLRLRHLDPAGLGAALERPEPKRPMRELDQRGTGLSVSAVEDALKRAGFADYEVNAEDNEIRLGAMAGDIAVSFEISIDDTWDGISIISASRDHVLRGSALTTELLRRLLVLNSENKIGSVGIQDLKRDDLYRIWVDHYLAIDGRVPSQEAVRISILAIVAVHTEVADALAATGATRSLVPL